MSAPRRRIAVAIAGASGAAYGLRLLEVLLARREVETHFLLSPQGAQIVRLEVGLRINPEKFDPASLKIRGADRLRFHHHERMSSPLASGSFRLDAMAVVPCSMACAAAIAGGASRNLIERAADVMLKERRTLIVVPRETPWSLIHLENMARLSRAGAIVMPACPGFYGRPKKVADLVDFVVGRVLDHLSVPHSLGCRWQGPDEG